MNTKAIDLEKFPEYIRELYNRIKITAEKNSKEIKLIKFNSNGKAPAAISGGDYGFTIKLDPNSKFDTNILLLHELLHLEFFFKYPIIVKPRNFKHKEINTIMNLCRILNNLIHHIYINDKIDNHYKLSRYGILQEYYNMYSKSLISYINAQKLSTIFPEHFIKLLKGVCDYKIQIRNYEEKNSYIKCDIIQIENASNEIHKIINSYRCISVENIEDSYAKIIKIIQKYLSREFNYTLILERQVEVIIHKIDISL